MSVFAKNLRFLINHFEVTQATIAIHAEVRQTTVSNWAEGKTEPGIKELLAINSFFNMDIRDLLFSDIETGNLIGTLPEKLASQQTKTQKRIPVKSKQNNTTTYHLNDMQLSVVNEQDVSLIQMLLNEQHKVIEKLDHLRDLLLNHNKK